ncbi:Ldh family oxidoreductase [Bartonella sp. LJL80]
MSDLIRLSLQEMQSFALETLLKSGYANDHAKAIAEVICQGQRDDCHSHGLYRLLICIHSLQSGKVNTTAQPIIDASKPGMVRVDAQQGFSPLSFYTGLPFLVEKAHQHGLAAMVINHCYHFSALWPEVEAITQHGLVAMAMTPSHSWVAPAGGKKPVFGTNPFAFGWPRQDKFPYVFDFATSAVARGEIELHRRMGKPLADGWAVDQDGVPTTDPTAALDGAMLTFGGHKGSALSTMIELMAGSMIGDLTSLQSYRYDGGSKSTPYHGELILAFDPHFFGGQDYDAGQQSSEELFEAIVQQGARLPSERRYKARKNNMENGYVTVSKNLIADIEALVG